MKVLAGDDLRTVAFKVCTDLDRAGVTAVLTGGSAATVYVPEVCQSRDLDFVLQFVTGTGEEADRALGRLGYTPAGSQYEHAKNPLTLDFLSHFLYWNDRAALAQAVAVARSRGRSGEGSRLVRQ